ncbi:serine/threonine-protein kinase HipA [Faunimonas pinastri]|uniref:Serine/threonine-protein kinase HipA n=1 Tax=Faunimonas pinastri TaxID=1855383 RepID=A0A1H9JNB1_9HYPH|nr:type II toxin-antitoxin system HipA family toxin [Faunimonas pinastri]SEQ88310.1 serine/threonine-protein kinase HipA [Faunimonas pinastri]
MAQTKLQVCIGDTAQEVGTLWFESAGGREHSVFEYFDSWLNHPRAFALAPGMPLNPGQMFFKAANEHASPLPPPLADTTPDSWGRNIIRKDARTRGDRSAPLTEIDILMTVDDFSRIGALRLRTEEGAPFLASEPSGRHPIPPLLHLDQLGHLISEAEKDEPEMTALRRVRQIGTALGGARPKCSVIDHDGRLTIAKFTSRHDTYPVERAEVMTLNLAKLCGLRTPAARVEMSGGLPVAVIERFDRSASGGRASYLSAQSMLEANVAVGSSYVQLADAIRVNALTPPGELRELFSRIAFTILVSNVDDHLKNHGFLYKGNGQWQLSPVFDVNPAPERFKELKTAIGDPAVPDASISLLMDYAFYFELSEDAAAKLIGEMAHTIEGNWQGLARQAGMNGAEINIYKPAFDHKEALEARALVKAPEGSASRQNEDEALDFNSGPSL